MENRASSRKLKWKRRWDEMTIVVLMAWVEVIGKRRWLQRAELFVEFLQCVFEEEHLGDQTIYQDSLN
jgi:hypothetical protein